MSLLSQAISFVGIKLFLTAKSNFFSSSHTQQLSWPLLPLFLTPIWPRPLPIRNREAPTLTTEPLCCKTRWRSMCVLPPNSAQRFRKFHEIYHISSARRILKISEIIKRNRGKWGLLPFIPLNLFYKRILKLCVELRDDCSVHNETKNKLYFTLEFVCEKSLHSPKNYNILKSER